MIAVFLSQSYIAMGNQTKSEISEECVQGIMKETVVYDMEHMGEGLEEFLMQFK